MTQRQMRLARYLLLAVGSAALVLPFLGKAPHIDEESYLFIGREILEHPLRPYDWSRAWQPHFSASAEHSFIYAHPPLFLWCMTLLIRLFGEDQIAVMRLAMSPFAILLGMSLFAVASRTTHRPWLVTAAIVLSPATLLIVHQSLMIDLPYIALSTASVALLLEARACRSARWAGLAGLVLGLAILTKYPALLLVLLGAAGWDARDRALNRRVNAVFVVVALLPCLLWQFWTAYQYGAPHLWYVVARAGEIERSTLFSRFVGDLAQLGGAAFAPTVAALGLFFSKGRLPRVAAGALLAGSTLWVIGLAASPAFAADAGWVARLADDLVGRTPQGTAAWLLLGTILLLGSLTVSGIRFRRQPGRILSIWALAMLAAALVGHNFASARYLVPAAIPLQILLFRRLEREGGSSWPLVAAVAVALGGILSLAVAYADYRQASVYSRLAADVEDAVSSRAHDADVWFSGEWGFRYEMEKRGYRYLEPDAALRAGDFVVFPRTACPGDRGVVGARSVILERSYGRPGFRTLAPGEGIGLYTEVLGFLPYGFSGQPLEEVEVWKVGTEASLRPKSRDAPATSTFANQGSARN